MTDAWSDRKRRSIMNLCVNCKLGTTFLSSIESSAEAHTGKYIFDYVDKWIEEVGPKNVIQVVTDNASNNIHSDFSLLYTGKMPKFKFVIVKSKDLTVFIYAHHKTLALMRKFTKKRDIVRPGVTRFASSFLTMQSLLEKQENLKYMFLSQEWLESKWSSTAKGSKTYTTIVSQSYWQTLTMCVEIFKPLVKVLRLVDGDWRPSMGFVYGELKDAKEEIVQICKGAKDMYEPILDIIELKAKDRLDGPLHLAGYLLNPYYFYRDDESQKDPKCMSALLTCVESFFPDDYDKQNLVCNNELLKYKEMEGIFGRKIAVSGRSKNDEHFNPVSWWSNYGSETPNLQFMAMKILSLTTSFSGCERNWSTFEGIHTKKRNRLDATRMRDLVYVQFNSKLLNKKKKDKHDVLLADDASMAQAWIAGVDEDDDVESQGSTSVVNEMFRDLDEDNFESDNEEVNDDFTFEDENMYRP